MATTADAHKMKGHCPKCGPDRNADVVGHHVAKFEDDIAGIWGQTDYRILVCRGCDTTYFQIGEVFSEDIDHREHPVTGEMESYLPSRFSYWPSPSKRERPKWFDELYLSDELLNQLLTDIYGALDADLRVPAAIAIRTAFDRASRLLGIDAIETFQNKVKALKEAGKISADESLALDALTDAGNAAAHRGWRPKPKELDTMMSLLEAFIHRTFVLGRAANDLRLLVPAKENKKRKGSNIS